jgi:hypothetical protein
MRLDEACVLSLSLVLGCSGSTPAVDRSAADETSSGDEPSAHAVEGHVEERCLPFVAAECGCVYPCAPGRQDAEGHWTVHAEPWGDLPGARIDRFCVDGECADAFHVLLVCTITCAPRPADETCHFDDGQCVSERVAPPD